MMTKNQIAKDNWLMPTEVVAVNSTPETNSANAVKLNTVPMLYNVTMKATVEAESAEAAEQMVFDKAAGDVDVTAVPTKEWLVSVDYTSCLTFRVTVHAESAEDAESKADELVAKASFFDGIPGVLDLAEFGHILTDRIEAYDAEPADDDEEAEPTEPATATETSAA